MTAKKPNELKLQSPKTLSTKHGKRIRTNNQLRNTSKRRKRKLRQLASCVELGCREKCNYVPGRVYTTQRRRLCYWNVVFCPHNFLHFNDMSYIKSFLITTFEIKEADGLAVRYLMEGYISCTEHISKYFLLKDVAVVTLLIILLCNSDPHLHVKHTIFVEVEVCSYKKRNIT